jgi:predicted dehydrogenase
MRWGILSTGMIARTFAKAVLQSRSGKLHAVGSRTAEHARTFASEFKIPNAYGTYEELLGDKSVEAVYVATPHPFHMEWTLAAMRAGKHVLCEKPLGMNLVEAERMVRSAQASSRILMEAVMYRCHPQTARLLDLVRKKAVGEVRMIRSSFCFDRDLGLKHRLFNKTLGGGAILDLGCYPVSMSRLLAGAAWDKPFSEPTEVKGSAHIGDKSRVDEWASAVLKFPGDILAEVSCATRVDREPGFLRIYGTEGQITVRSPWHCTVEPGESKILVERKGESVVREMSVKADRSLYAYEADAFAEAVSKGRVEPPAMTSEDSLGNAAVLDQWLASAKGK